MRGYCRNCTNEQLRNVYADEKRRGKYGGEVGKEARKFAQAAREELIHRGLLDPTER